jgi:3-hydroxybutyryl-CoA dehydrogenase/5-formyl-3-hydroxy-2-methylpyridine 4-carboxylate dehydrogenase
MTKVAVIGLGTMGPGITATLARGGMEVSAFDVDSEVLEAGQNNIDLAFKILDALGTPECSIVPVRLTSELEDCVDGADLVIENVPEDIGVKLPLFKELEKLVSAGCVLASDSSGIPISRLQDGSNHPGRFIGMHWSNPPHIIPMIEVIAGKKTDMQVVDWLMKMIRDLGLIPVFVKKDVPGFVENRVLYALLRECVDLVERGVIDPVDLDTCVSWGIGYKLSVIGPMALLDMAGLDIYEAVGTYLNKDLCQRNDVSSLIKDKTKAGKLGIKSRDGLFSYTSDQVKTLRAERARSLVAVRKALESSMSGEP